MRKIRRARLLVIDVDGTLLTDDYRLMAATRTAVQQVSAQGVQVVLASARSARALHAIMGALRIMGLAICYTGALTCRISPDPHMPTEVMMEQRMNLSSANDVLNNALERGISSRGQFSLAHYLEITHQGVDKATALLALGQQLGITPAEMVAVGDGENDLAMLRLVGLGIAMGNAPPSVQTAADWVTDTNNRDGVAIAIERLQATGWL